MRVHHRPALPVEPDQTPHKPADDVFGTHKGLCCYVNWLCDERRHPPQEHALFSAADWAWAQAHEQEALHAVALVLDSANPAEISRFAQWHVYPWEGAVDRLAYYLGFRLCQAYVRGHGEGSWRDLCEQEPRVSWDASGYAAPG